MGPLGRGLGVWDVGLLQRYVSSCGRACLGFAEVGSIAVYVEYHVTGMKPDNDIWVRGAIIEELYNGQHGVFSWLCLLGGDCAQCFEHSTVNGACIEEECSQDFLDAGGVA